MSTPSPARFLFTSALLGLATGAVEVAARSTPRLGMDTTELLAWLGLSSLLCAAYAISAALVSLAAATAVRRWWGWHLPALGLVAAALVLVQAALYYRFERVLNLFASDPRVWGGLLLIAAGSLLVGLLLHRPLSRLSGWLDLASGMAVAVAALVALAANHAPPTTTGSASGPSVVLITLDTVRRDALAPYGGPVDTPSASRLAREGVLFEQAIASAPLTEPSHLAILTGLAPYSSGVVSNGTVIGKQPALLSHAFAAAGYRVGGFVSGFPLHGKYGWTQGFHVYDDDFGAIPGLHRLSLVKAWDQLALPAHALRERRGDQALARALHWLDQVEDEPFFLWLHLFDPHAPYEAPAPWAPDVEPQVLGAPPLDLPGYFPPWQKAITDPDWFVANYHGEVRYADHLVGLLLEHLEHRGLLDQVVLALTADHGESLTEHDYLFDHGDDLYDPSLRVPLIVRYPPSLPAALRQPCQVATLDLAPTLLELAHVPDTAPRDGHSLLPMLQGGECQAQDVVSTTVAGRFVERPPVDHSLRARDRKYIQHEQGDAELYDLLQDPGELRDLSDERPEEASALSLVLSETLGAEVEVQGPEMGAETQDALRALGYIE